MKWKHHHQIAESYLGVQLSNIHNSHLLKNITQQFDDDVSTSYDRHKNIIIYSSFDEFRKSMKSGEVLLGIIIEENENQIVYCLCKSVNGISLHKLLFNDFSGTHKYAMWYSSMIPQESQKHLLSTKELDEYNFDYCIGIPDINTENELIAYTFLSKNWTCRQQNGQFMLPKISRNIMNYYKNKSN